MPSTFVDNDFFVDFEVPAACDNRGKPLTKEQVDFFAQSKCVDESGALYRVYRAGSKDYDSFDKSKIGSGAGYIYGKGFYFGVDRESVKMYGNIIKEYYLNLKNPYIYEAVDFDEDALYNIDTFINILKQNNFHVTEALKMQLTEDIFENDGGLDTLIELTCGVDKITDFLQACGYDGIMNLDVLDFVAFEPNQIKLCSNKAPTGSEMLAASFQKDKSNNT